MTVTHGGVTTPVAGLVGLVPEYYNTGHLAPIDQEWVTSCLLARVNQAGQTVQIDMRGNRPDLGLNAPTPGFRAWEAILFGNIFAPKPAIYACASQTSGPATLANLGRFCNTNNPDCAPFKKVDCEACDYKAGDTPLVRLLRLTEAQPRRRRSP